MNKFGVCVALCAFGFCALLINPFRAYADSVTLALESTGGQVSGPGYVYPYNFSVNGSASTTPMMCLSYTNDIYFGESWKATVVSVSGNSEYEEAAYIFSLASASSATQTTIAEAQWANWELFDPSDPNLLSSEPSQYQSGVTSMLSQASMFVKDNPNASLYSDYLVYLPVANSWPAGDGAPQNLMGLAPTPEPSSLILLGSGLLGAAILLYRRRHLVEKTTSQADKGIIPRSRY